MKRIDYEVVELDRGEGVALSTLSDLGDRGYQLVCRHECEDVKDDPDSGNLGRTFHYPKVQLIFAKQVVR